MIGERNRTIDAEYFLHQQGYNFFNSGQLTIDEINRLIEGKNKQIKQQKLLADRNQRKNKRRR